MTTKQQSEARHMNAETPSGRVAVITGAAGYRVALLARRAERVDALAEELGDSAIAIQADVTDRDSLLAASHRVWDETNLLGAWGS